MNTLGVGSTRIPLKFENVRFHLNNNEQASQRSSEWVSSSEKANVAISHHKFQIVVEKFNLITAHLSHFLLNDSFLDVLFAFFRDGSFFKQFNLNFLLKFIFVLH